MPWRRSLLVASAAVAFSSFSWRSTSGRRRIGQRARAVLDRVPGVTLLPTRLRLLALERRQEATTALLRESEPLRTRLRLAELERRQEATTAFLRDAEPQLVELERRDRVFENRIAQLELAEDARDARAQSAAAIAWDREAVIRRLAALEDALADRY